MPRKTHFHITTQLDLVYTSRKNTPMATSAVPAHALSGDSLTRRISNEAAEFEERFLRTFPGIGAYNASQKEFAMSTFSSLIGGIGYKEVHAQA